MSGFTECPNCVKDQVMVPLGPDGNSMVCPFCESFFFEEFFLFKK